MGYYSHTPHDELTYSRFVSGHCFNLLAPNAKHISMDVLDLHFDVFGHQYCIIFMPRNSVNMDSVSSALPKIQHLLFCFDNESMQDMHTLVRVIDEIKVLTCLFIAI